MARRCDTHIPMIPGSQTNRGISGWSRTEQSKTHRVDGIQTHMADPVEGRIPKHTPSDCEVNHTSGDDDLLKALVNVPA